MATPPRPEPKFFLVDELYARGLDWYAHQWFAAAPAKALCGEKSTNYLESASAARRMAGDLPEVRLIFLLREPAERAWSNYLWSCMNGAESETFARALDLEEEREGRLGAEHRFSRPHAYFSRGLYADLLEPWFGGFAREQILCLRYEDLVTAPGRLAERVHRFLGVVPRSRDADGLGTINAANTSGPDGARQPPPDVLRRLRARYTEPNRRLARLLGPTFEVWS
jgi:hypothetical protein